MIPKCTVVIDMPEDCPAINNAVRRRRQAPKCEDYWQQFPRDSYKYRSEITNVGITPRPSLTYGDGYITVAVTQRDFAVLGID